MFLQFLQDVNGRGDRFYDGKLPSPTCGWRWFSLLEAFGSKKICRKMLKSWRFVSWLVNSPSSFFIFRAWMTGASDVELKMSDSNVHDIFIWHAHMMYLNINLEKERKNRGRCFIGMIKEFFMMSFIIIPNNFNPTRIFYSSKNISHYKMNSI